MAVADLAARYSSKKALNVESPSFTPSLLQPINKKPTFSSQAVTAPSFTPRGLGGKSEALSVQTLDFLGANCI
jgi:PAB-dependent poly(A)-specific ribonuclease subunit 3